MSSSLRSKDVDVQVTDESQMMDGMRAAAVRPMLAPGRWFWPIVVVLSLLVVAAVGAWAYQISVGLGVTGLSDRVFWGMYITNLVTFVGLSYGGAVVSAILRLTGATWRAPITRLAEATAFVTLVVGAAYIFADLGHPERAINFLISPNTSSPLVWDAVAVGTYMVATLIFLYLPMIPDMAIASRDLSGKVGPFRRKIFRVLSVGFRDLPGQRHALERATGVVAVLIIPIAVVVHSVLSWAFAVTTREGWHSTIFGPYFVVAALFSGVAAVILVTLGFRRAYGLQKQIPESVIRNLAFIMLTLGLIYLYFTFTELLSEGYPMSHKGAELVQLLLIGQYAPQFWLFVGAGLVIPVLLVALPITRNVVGIGVAAFLVVQSMWLKRFLIIVPPQAVALIVGEVGHYRPTLIEGIITLGGMAAVPLFLMIFFRLFPIISIAEMEELIGPEHAAPTGHAVLRGEVGRS